MISSLSLCQIFRKMVNNGDKAVECKICNQRYHVKYENIIKEEFKILNGGSKKITTKRCTDTVIAVTR